jgi:hypothetical protein
LIIKHRSKPIIIDKLEALLKRMPFDLHKTDEIQEQIRNFSSGYRGEQSLDYFYRYLPTHNVYYLHGIRILHQGYYFQIDTLILTRNFFLILDSKNISGHLYFDDAYSQMIRTLNDRKEAFDNPIEQVKRQAYHLMEVLKFYKFEAVPIESLVVITNPRTIVESSSTYKEAREKVIKSPVLSIMFEKLSSKHNTEILSTKDLKRIIKLLNKLHTIEDYDVCSFYQVKKESLMKGVYCPECDSFLERRKRSWYCLTCKKTFNKAHLPALRDYALLVSTSITNKECREFLNLPSSSQSYQLLSSLNVPYSGSTKSRKYDLSSLFTSKE